MLQYDTLFVRRLLRLLKLSLLPLAAVKSMSPPRVDLFPTVTLLTLAITGHDWLINRGAAGTRTPVLHTTLTTRRIYVESHYL